jgi:hypothetical protein
VLFLDAFRTFRLVVDNGIDQPGRPRRFCHGRASPTISGAPSECENTGDGDRLP